MPLLLLAVLLLPKPAIEIAHVDAHHWRLTNHTDARLILNNRQMLQATDARGEAWPVGRQPSCGNFRISLFEPGQADTFYTTNLDTQPPGRYSVSLALSVVESDDVLVPTLTIEQTRPPIAIKPLLRALDAADKHGCAEVIRPVAAFFATEATSAEVQRVGRHLADRDLRLWHGFVQGTLTRATWFAEWTDRMSRLDDGREMVLLGLLVDALDAGGRANREWLKAKHAELHEATNAISRAGVIEAVETAPVWNDLVEQFMVGVLARPGGLRLAAPAFRARVALLDTPARRALVARIIKDAPSAERFAQTLLGVPRARTAGERPAAQCVAVKAEIDALLIARPRDRRVHVAWETVRITPPDAEDWGR